MSTDFSANHDDGDVGLPKITLNYDDIGGGMMTTNDVDQQQPSMGDFAQFGQSDEAAANTAQNGGEQYDPATVVSSSENGDDGAALAPQPNGETKESSSAVKSTTPMDVLDSLYMQTRNRAELLYMANREIRHVAGDLDRAEQETQVKKRKFITLAAGELEQLKAVCDAREQQIRAEMRVLRRADEEKLTMQSPALTDEERKALTEAVTYGRNTDTASASHSFDENTRKLLDVFASLVARYDDPEAAPSIKLQYETEITRPDAMATADIINHGLQQQPQHMMQQPHSSTVTPPVQYGRPMMMMMPQQQPQYQADFDFGGYDAGPMRAPPRPMRMMAPQQVMYGRPMPQQGGRYAPMGGYGGGEMGYDDGYGGGGYGPPRMGAPRPRGRGRRGGY